MDYKDILGMALTIPLQPLTPLSYLTLYALMMETCGFPSVPLDPGLDHICSELCSLDGSGLGLPDLLHWSVVHVTKG